MAKSSGYTRPDGVLDHHSGYIARLGFNPDSGEGEVTGNRNAGDGCRQRRALYYTRRQTWIDGHRAVWMHHAYPAKFPVHPLVSRACMQHELLAIFS